MDSIGNKVLKYLSEIQMFCVERFKRVRIIQLCFRMVKTK